MMYAGTKTSLVKEGGFTKVRQISVFCFRSNFPGI